MIVLLVMTVQSLFAQNENCEEITNKKAIKLYEEAAGKISTGLKSERSEAYILLKKAVEMEPEFVDAFYLMAEYNYNMANKASQDILEAQNIERYTSQAQKYFQEVINLCPSFSSYKAYYYVGEYYYDMKDYANAKQFLSSFKNKNTKNTTETKRANAWLDAIDAYNKLRSTPVPFEPKVLAGISTKSDEFLPIISPDGQLALFTRAYMKEAREDIYSKFVEELMISTRINEPGTVEKFTAGETMKRPFNDGRNQGGVTISIDNNHLFISICETVIFNKKPYNNCDLYTSDNEDGMWTPLRKLGPQVNGQTTWEGQPSLSADGKTLYFASARDGGLGGIDIYCATQDANGNWGNVKNLGNKINTSGDDKSPFMHSDSQTLYFSSEGKNGVGGFDIYYSKMNLDGTWTEPKNIGYPINSESDDLAFVVSTDGKKAYFASNQLKGLGGWDIYSFDLYKEARPEKVLLVKGQLKDDNGDFLTDAKVEMKSATTSRVTEGLVDKVTGRYAVIVAVKENEEFIMTVRKPDYSFTSQYFNTEDIKKEKPIEVNLEVKPIEVGKIVKLNNIQFATNSAVFDKGSIVVLNSFVEFLESNPNVKIAIHGHTDNVGDDKSNLTLSKNRAKAVFDYLVLMGIDVSRMTHEGFGKTKPISSNETEFGRAKNRRTEFVIEGK